MTISWEYSKNNRNDNNDLEEIKQLIKECCPCPASIQKTADTMRNNSQNQPTEVNSMIPSEKVDNDEKKQESSKVMEFQKENRTS